MLNKKYPYRFSAIRNVLCRATRDYRVEVGMEDNVWDKTFTGTLPYEHSIRMFCDQLHYEVIDVFTMGRYFVRLSINSFGA